MPLNPRAPEFQFKTKGRESAMRALRQLAEGVANAEEQKLALAYIVGDICDSDGISFDRDPYATAFMEGRRYAGSAIKYICNAPGGELFGTKMRTK